ncbi:MAG: VOC family protein [Actinomycetota bacterium]
MTDAPTRLTSIEPIFPVRDIVTAIEHYRALGFEVDAYAGDAPYAYAERDGVRFHLQQVGGRPGLKPKRNMFSVYLYCDDADALHAEWVASGAGGKDHPPSDTDYGLREGAHLDEDANLIRYGSPLS